MHLGVLATHPIQYHAPWYRALADRVELHVYYAHDPSDRERGESGFGASFDWDVDLLVGYPHTFLENVARSPKVDDQSFFGCDTPEIHDRIREENFDAFVVMGWHAKTFWQAVAACRRSETPVLARGDSQLDPTVPGWRRALKEVTHRGLLRAFDAFLAVGTRFDEYLQHYGVGSERIFRVPHCVDTDRFSVQARRAEANGQVSQLQNKLTVREETVFLFVGKMVPNKRPGLFVEAVHRFSRKNSDVRGVLVGAGPLDTVLQNQRDDLGAPVSFEGFQNQTRLPAYYVLADALVLPSNYPETWGLVVNEAMACGTPAIVSQAAGCAPDMIEEGKTGYTFPVDDMNALCDRMWALEDRLAREERPFAAEVRETSRRHSPETAAERTVEAVGALLSSSTA